MTNALENVLEILEWFSYHNKNLTKTQGYKIDEAIQILKRTLKGKETNMSDKYVVKVYDTGMFYGYLAKHPDNEVYTYYVNEIEDAIKFDSFSDAENQIERVTQGSTFDAVVVYCGEELKSCNELKEIWTVDRNSPEDGEQGTPVKVFSTREDAIKCMHKLNEKAFGCVVDCNGWVTDVEDDYLYYNIGSFDVDDEQY